MKDEKVRKKIVFGMVLMLVFSTFVIVQVNVSANEYECPSCGSPIEQGIDHCPYCGHAFDWDNHILITDYLNRRVIEVEHTGSSIVWSYYSADNWWPFDSERLANGNTLIGEVNYYSQTDRGRVIEIDVSGTILWELTGLNLAMDVERLSNGNTLICETHGNRVIEVDSAKNIVWKMDSGLYYPVDAERLENGNTLIVDQYHDRIIEVEPDLDIVWETPYVGAISLVDAERLDNGNTLITSFMPGYQKVYELNPLYVEVWDEDESIYPMDAERLEDGNTLIVDGYVSNRVFKLDSAGNVVWEVIRIPLNWPSDAEALGKINQPPVAEAGADQTVEQTSYAGVDVTLDGSGSYDPDDDPLTYEWTWDGGSAAGVNPTVTFPFGTTTVTLTVCDGELTDADTVDINIVDTTPPEITLSDESIVLWPPNHKYHTIEITDFVISVTDICDSDVDVDDVIITSVSSDEPEDVKGGGDGNTLDDIVIVDEQTVDLRAERQGSGNGRVYTINFKVTDKSENTATGSFQVSVPHDKKSDAIDDGAAAGYTVYP